MEEGYRSSGGGGHSREGVIKSRSGCLIIKKKIDAVDGVGSRPPIVYQSKKEKKRLRLIASNSGSSGDEMVELYRRRGVPGTSQVASGSVVHKKGTVKGSDFSRKKSKLEYRNQDLNFGRTELRERDRKESKLDVYEFDEYDDLTDVEMMRMFPYSERVFESSGRSFLSGEPVKSDGSGRTFDAGSSRHSLSKSRKSPFPGGRSSERIRDVDHSLSKRNDLTNELSIRTLKPKFGSSSAEPIRLQGKNGVLKVMVNKKKVDGTYKTQTYEDVRGNNSVSKSLEITPINTVVHPPFYSEKKTQNKPSISKRTGRGLPKSRKTISSDSNDHSDEASESSDTPSKHPSETVEARKSMKRVRGEGGSNSSPESPPIATSKEGKVKRGSGTEKQLLREKIRSMLTNAGWKIDYRPRRNRDYFDAVYINPSGTAYWSIIKAYDAFQKQLEDEGTQARTEGSPYAPISGEVLSKLTRQTRKKIEKERKKKKKKDAEKRRKKASRAAKFMDDDYGTDSSENSLHEEKLSSFIKQSGKSLKGRLQEARYNERSSLTSKVQDRAERCSSASNNRPIHGRKTNKIGRCTLLVRSSEKGVNSDGDDFVPYAGKRTLLSWLIDSGTVKLSEKVHYMNRKRTRIMLEGWITRDGVHCGCCSKILTVFKFEIHAASKLRQPFQNIYLSSGVSLMQCQVDAWNRQDESHRKGFHAVDVDGDDPNDDTCGICGDGGDLICCDGCPSTFHQTCLDIEMLPAGDWHCPHCSCKFCGGADMSAADVNDRTLGLLQRCSLCERKYHTSCIQETHDVLTSPKDNVPFCGQSCQQLSEQLQKLLGVKHELESGLSWSLIRRTDLDCDSSLRGFAPRVEWNSKLAVASTVMDECFLPIIDRRSGINLIHNVLYNCGSNFNRLNYNGFYTAILERGDEIISAASIRIHGTRLAEMPFIGTRHIYRRQGMCRRLFFAIESALHSVKVEKLIIPAISELMHTWTGLFGFGVIHESVKQEMKSMNILVFPGIDMLQKELLPQETVKTDEAAVTGKKSSKPDGTNCGLSSACDAATASGFFNVETDDKPVPGINVKQPVVSLNENSATSHEDKRDVLMEEIRETSSSRVGLEEKLAEPAPEEKVKLSTPVSTDILEERLSLVNSAAACGEGGTKKPKAHESPSSRVGLEDKLAKPAPGEKVQLSTPVSDDILKERNFTVNPAAPCCAESTQELKGHDTPSSRVGLEDKLAEPAPEEKVQLSTSVSIDILNERNSLVNSVATCGGEGTEELKAHDADSESPPQGTSSSKSLPLDGSQMNVHRASFDGNISGPDPGDKAESGRESEHAYIDAGNDNFVAEVHKTGSAAEGEVKHAYETIARDNDASLGSPCLDASYEFDISDSNAGIVCSSDTDEISKASADDVKFRSKASDDIVLDAEKPQVDPSVEVNVVHLKEVEGNCTQELGSEVANRESVCDSSFQRSD